jgi:hypothetical protein
VIYFVEAPYRGHKAIKIGYSDSFDGVELRLRSLQTGNPHHLRLLAVCPGSIEDEKQLHHDHAEDRLGGEWFWASKTLRSAVRRAKNTDWHAAFDPVREAEQELIDTARAQLDEIEADYERIEASRWVA